MRAKNRPQVNDISGLSDFAVNRLGSTKSILKNINVKQTPTEIHDDDAKGCMTLGLGHSNWTI